MFTYYGNTKRSNVMPYLLKLQVRGAEKLSLRYKCPVTWLSFDGKDWLATLPIPKLNDHTLSTVRDCLFDILFTATFHTGSRSYIRNLRMRHAMVMGIHLSQICSLFTLIQKDLYHLHLRTFSRFYSQHL